MYQQRITTFRLLPLNKPDPVLPPQSTADDPRSSKRAEVSVHGERTSNEVQARGDLEDLAGGLYDLFVEKSVKRARRRSEGEQTYRGAERALNKAQIDGKSRESVIPRALLVSQHSSIIYLFAWGSRLVKELGVRLKFTRDRFDRLISVDKDKLARLLVLEDVKNNLDEARDLRCLFFSKWFTLRDEFDIPRRP